MALLLALIQLFLILFICIYEYRLKSPIVFLWGTLLFMFGISHTITVIAGSFIYPDWVINIASIFVIIFCLLYLITRKILNRNCIIKEGKLFVLSEENTKGDTFFVIILFLFMSFFIILSMYKSIRFSGGLLNTSWGDNLQTNNIYDIIGLWFYFASSGIVLYLLLKQKIKILFIILIFIFIYVIITRNRILILPVFISFISYFIFNTKLTLRKVLLFPVLSIGVIYIIYGLLVFRHYGTIDNFIESFSFSGFHNTIIKYLSEDNGELGLKDVFYFFIYNDNNFANFEKGHTYIRLLLVLIPSGILEGIKPPDFALSMGAAVNPSLVGFSTHPTLFGDCFANFGFLGVFLGIFWAFFASILDSILYKSIYIYQTYLYVLFSCTYVIIARGSVYNGCSLMVWCSIIIFATYKLSRHFKDTYKR